MKPVTFWWVMRMADKFPSISDDSFVSTHRFLWTARLEAFLRNLFNPVHYVC